jgi:hypothetical protein
METGDLRFWRLPTICWALFAFFASLTLILQVVDVVLGDVMLHPHKEREYLVCTIGLGGLSVGFFILARRAKKSN